MTVFNGFSSHLNDHSICSHLKNKTTHKQRGEKTAHFLSLSLHCIFCTLCLFIFFLPLLIQVNLTRHGRVFFLRFPLDDTTVLVGRAEYHWILFYCISFSFLNLNLCAKQNNMDFSFFLPSHSHSSFVLHTSTSQNIHKVRFYDILNHSWFLFTFLFIIKWQFILFFFSFLPDHSLEFWILNSDFFCRCRGLLQIYVWACF